MDDHLSHLWREPFEGDFVMRHIGPRKSDQVEMLKVLGFDSAKSFINAVIPEPLRSTFDFEAALGEPLSEHQALSKLYSMLSENRVTKCYYGMGFYPSLMPSVIRRNVLENPNWYTAYTPYQAEISQGRLESLINFQTMIVDLTGLPLAGASLLDEGSAAAEAVGMALNLSKMKSQLVFLDQELHPHVRAVIQTRMKPLNVDIEVLDVSNMDFACRPAACVLAYPGTTGVIRDLKNVVENAKNYGSLVIVDVDLLSLTLIKPPGEWGADIVVGNSQRFGLPLFAGGPHAAFLATRDEFKRQLPGRLIGVTIDKKNKLAYRLTLQTREQHIRRDKATSNICTAQVLLANIAAMYAVYHGPEGLKAIASRIHKAAQSVEEGLKVYGLNPVYLEYFDTLHFLHPDAQRIVEGLIERNIFIRAEGQGFCLSLDETKEWDDIAYLIEAFGESLNFTSKISEAKRKAYETFQSQGSLRIRRELQRTSDFLTHPRFHKYKSETEMLRYIKRLEARDITLTRSMIPLGSCTMKLNATTELLPLGWSVVSDIHPFAPVSHQKGYLNLIQDLESKLKAITGFDAISFQPNSGAQGEYAGLLAIRGYHQSRGEGHRNICLIPKSAHGTNPASAVMAGFRVIVVDCDEMGNISAEDLRKKATQYQETLAALMVTYPSTHGVFEEHIKELCSVVHEMGGQVYMDGANLNALVGFVRPSELGADVGHMNLHKTFAIPHGGGGPGVGPIGVKKHLAPFLPNHPLMVEAGPDTGVGPVTSAPWGSLSLLTISWLYLSMMGARGLKLATYQALLSANYIAKKLEKAFPILYRGRNGWLAHECILDLRPFREIGIDVVDVAKRLMDFGYHSPTMSWPEPGTLMVEPTESESLEELNRFIEALIRIRWEIDQVGKGVWPKDNNPLVYAPHTAEELVNSDWSHPYSREEAAFPLPWVKENKYWPPVARVNDAFGDKNVFCTCPPLLEEYRD